MNISDVFKSIKEDKVISKEITGIFLELDVMNSVATQASLNDMLVDLRKRVETEDIVVEQISGENKTTVEEFDSWIDNNFTVYSSRLYKETISGSLE